MMVTAEAGAAVEAVGAEIGGVADPAEAAVSAGEIVGVTKSCPETPPATTLATSSSAPSWSWPDSAPLATENKNNNNNNPKYLAI